MLCKVAMGLTPWLPCIFFIKYGIILKGPRTETMNLKLSDKIILLFYKRMFDNKDVVIGKLKFPLQKTAGLRSFKIGNLLLIEQNPAKKSKWGEKAKKGEKIMWILDQKVNKYLYSIINGKVFKIDR